MSDVIKEIDTVVTKYEVKPSVMKDITQNFEHSFKATENIDKSKQEDMAKIYARDGIIIRG